MKTANCMIVILTAALCGSASAKESVSFLRELKTGLKKPVDVAVSADGQVYVLDETLAQVAVFDKDGNAGPVFGGRGSKHGQFSKPKSIAVSPKGSVFVADTANSRVQIFDGEGKFLAVIGGYGSWPGLFKRPAGVAVDSFGFIYVADTGNTRLQIFSPGGVFVDCWKVSDEPNDIEVDVQGNVYVLLAKAKKVLKYSASGKLLNKISCVEGKRARFSPYGSIVVDARGDIYMTGNEDASVRKFDSDQNMLLSFGSEGDGRGQFDEPMGIAADSHECVYVTDSANERVQVFRVHGITKRKLSPRLSSSPFVEIEETIDVQVGVVDIFLVPKIGICALSDRAKQPIVIRGKKMGQCGRSAGQLRLPRAICAMADGRICVVDKGSDCVQILKSDGSVDYQFGRSGRKNGQFDAPEGIVVNGTGNICVADTSNDRIQIFTADGIFLKAIDSFDNPTALAVDSGGRLFILDQNNSRVRTLDDSGKPVDVFECGKASDMTIDENDLVYIADKDNYLVRIFDTTGESVGVFGSAGENLGAFEELSAVAAGDGKTYAADYRKKIIQVFRVLPYGIDREGAPVLRAVDAEAADKEPVKEEAVDEEPADEKPVVEEKPTAEAPADQPAEPEPKQPMKPAAAEKTAPQEGAE